MSVVPGWLGRLDAGLTELSKRLDERRTDVDQESREAQGEQKRRYGPEESGAYKPSSPAGTDEPAPVPVPNQKTGAGSAVRPCRNPRTRALLHAARRRGVLRAVGSRRRSCRGVPCSAHRRSRSRSTQCTWWRSPHAWASRVKEPLVTTTAVSAPCAGPAARPGRQRPRTGRRALPGPGTRRHPRRDQRTRLDRLHPAYPARQDGPATEELKRNRNRTNRPTTN
jgi:hypothetical protein